jgi:hypothetical protein
MSSRPRNHEHEPYGPLSETYNVSTMPLSPAATVETHTLDDEKSHLAPDPFVVVYRVGGTENFKWLCTFAEYDHEVMQNTLKRITQMGYYAYMTRLRTVQENGVPTTYNYWGNSKLGGAPVYVG